MLQTFLKLWLLILIASFASWNLQTKVLFKRMNSAGFELRAQEVDRSIAHIKQVIAGKPELEWPGTVAAAAGTLTFPTQVVSTASVVQRLTADERESFSRRGFIHVRKPEERGTDIFYQVPGSQSVIHLERLFASADRNLFGLSSETLTWASEAMMYAVAATLALWLLWRDLRKIVRTAHRVGDGHFDTHVELSRGSALRPIGDAFNSMTRRVAELLTSHRDLTNAVAHELKTPLARLRFALTLSEEARTPEDRQRFAERMNTDIGELEKLVEEMLIYARLDRNPAHAHIAPARLSEWLDAVVEDARASAAAQGKTINISEDAGLASVSCDAQFMAKAVSNLLQNAVRYAKTRIALTVSATDRAFSISVDDDGPGVPKKARHEIFEPFTRLDESRDRNSGGVGLGLAIVRKVAEWHRGEVLVTESSLGGARFVIRWPTIQ